MAFEVQAVHHGVSDFQAGGIHLVHQERFDFQTCFGHCAADEGQQRLKSAQGVSRPIEADWPKQAMLNRVPFRGARRVMTDGHFQAELIGEQFLHLLLPQAWAIAIAPARVTQDQQFVSGWKVRAAKGAPPRGDHLHRKLGRIGGLADVDVAPLVGKIVNAIGHGFAERVLLKIVFVRKGRGKAIFKTRDVYLRRAVMVALDGLLKNQPVLRTYYRRLRQATPAGVARVATARRAVGILWAIQRDQRSATLDVKPESTM